MRSDNYSHFFINLLLHLYEAGRFFLSSQPSESQQNRGNIFCINTLLSQVEKLPALIKFSLRYYAIFKVKKFESLICKINTCLQKTATINFGRGFCGSFSMLFPEAPATCDKKVLK